ncbi:MAG: S8 family serine peptidase [Pseudomonadota bacterium]
MKVKISKEFKYFGISVLKAIDKKRPVKEIIKELYESGLVEYAEPDYVVDMDLTPNDPQFGQLWGLFNTGQSGGTVDADIDASDAWDINTGNPDIVVGIIDTGVDYNHEDLSANMWTNPGEVPGNGIDDDGNGYVDDVHGIDAYNNDSDPMDDNGHGTHCSGTIGAVGNNGAGVVGVNWNVKIMALKFLSSGGSGYTSDAIECLNYAVMMKNSYDVDIRLTSNSWGGSGYSQALADAIETSKNAGMLFIAAAGNSSSDNDSTPHYPSSYGNDNIIAVASTDRNDNLSSFSSYGATSVDLGAPGSSILSTTPNDTYSTYSGTSMATPHVAGVAALIWARYPSYTFSDVKNLITSTVDPLSSLSGTVMSGGRLNVYSALSCSQGNPSMRISSPSSGFSAIVNQNTTVAVRLTDCVSPVTGATATVRPTNGDSAFNLLDNGISPDTTANDGIYSNTWTPSRTGAVTLNIEASGFGGTLTGSVAGNVIENYTYNDQVTYNWIDATTGTRISPFYDDDYESIAIGFDFVFYGNTYSAVKISSNGYLTFGTNVADYTNDPIPSTTDPDDFIAPFWDDLNPYAGGSVYYLLQGTAPNRTLTVEWLNVPHYYSPGTVTFEVILYEGTNNIVFQYQDVDFGTSSYNRGASATIGIENSDGSVGVRYSYNQASVSENMAILFSLSSSPTVPTAISGSATSVELTSATLNGTVNPNGASTTVIFEYGTDVNYGSSIAATQSPLAGTTAQSVSARPTGLKAGMTYHFRVTATNSVGTSNGSDKSFTTAAADVVYVEPGGSCGGNTPCYATIQEGINSAGALATIKIAQGTYSESFSLGQSKAITLQGGWDPTFSTQTSGTIIKSPTITSGSISFQNLIIRP